MCNWFREDYKSRVLFYYIISKFSKKNKVRLKEHDCGIVGGWGLELDGIFEEWKGKKERKKEKAPQTQSSLNTTT